MKFTKMHGAGNDFIIINNIEEKLPIAGFSKLAKKLCHRRFSIGADGLMVVEHPSAEVEERSTGYSNKIQISSTEGDCARTFATNIEARATNAEVQNCDFRMLFYNADGSVGEMCGNGARCIARYGYEHGLAEKVQRIETLSGIVEGQRVTDKKYKVRLNPVTKMDLDCVEIQMPKLMLENNRTFNADTLDTETLGLNDCNSNSLISESRNPGASILSIATRVSYVELGNPGLPHAVVECKGLQHIVEALKVEDEHGYIDDKACEKEENGKSASVTVIDKSTDMHEKVSDKTIAELKLIGKRLRYHEAFPKGANVNFYEIVGEDELYILTYERGVEDFTLACGTGTASTVAVLAEQGLVSGHGVRVHAAGGDLAVDVVNKRSETVDVVDKKNEAANVIAEKFQIETSASGVLVDVTKQHLYLTGEAEIVAEGEILHI